MSRRRPPPAPAVELELELGFGPGPGNGARTVRVAGVDEVGRGPLAGPVVAAAVILDPARPVAGLADSKALTPARRELVAEAIRASALAWALARATVEEVDELNVLGASLLAMRRAVLALDPAPSHVLVDGNHLPALPVPATAIVKGDARVAEIAAASILAKVSRDAEMVALDGEHPGYGFAAHKGYPSAVHLAALARLGVSPVHRRTFAPVRARLEEGAPDGAIDPGGPTPDP